MLRVRVQLWMPYHPYFSGWVVYINGKYIPNIDVIMPVKGIPDILSHGTYKCEHGEYMWFQVRAKKVNFYNIEKPYYEHPHKKIEVVV